MNLFINKKRSDKQPLLNKEYQILKKFGFSVEGTTITPDVDGGFITEEIFTNGKSTFSIMNRLNSLCQKTNKGKILRKSKKFSLRARVAAKRLLKINDLI